MTQVSSDSELLENMPTSLRRVNVMHGETDCLKFSKRDTDFHLINLDA